MVKANASKTHGTRFFKKLRPSAKLFGTTHSARLLDLASIALRRFLANLFRGDFHGSNLERGPTKLNAQFEPVDPIQTLPRLPIANCCFAV
ncbi:hypothetical protein GCM10007100_06720 [Roseibacillus persicicus]|uniref:Uncharacterized protein n=1 Tax=Roseibacillus persicicus TaxID=454148 RepID=A0A918WHC8_9BACT|nr:hypothetical protein GCM10007100_06720 [Roseibacillus persicicus]